MTTTRRVHVGTSGWTYRDWSGRFYPEDVRDADRLSYYAEQFDTVEVNATFYRLPFEGMITGWNRRLPPGFHLVLKGPRTITHLKKLRDCGEQVARFFERVGALRTLELVLWQLPPSLHKDVPRLDRFLDDLPPTVRHAVEFRHPTWYDQEVARMLQAHGAAFVAVSHPRVPEDIVPTSDLLYLRFHGLGRARYAHEYSQEELGAWAGRVRPLLEGRRSLYAFFNNDVGAAAVRNALVFRDLLVGNPESTQ